jgi:hypothetical protein
MFASADARFKEINNAWKARNAAPQAAAPQAAPAPAPTPVPVPTPVTTPTPVLRPRKTNAEWDAIAAEQSGGKYKTMAEVRALQQQLGINPDGKWGSQTQAAYDAYLAQQN